MPRGRATPWRHGCAASTRPARPHPWWPSWRAHEAPGSCARSRRPPRAGRPSCPACRCLRGGRPSRLGPFDLDLGDLDAALIDSGGRLLHLDRDVVGLDRLTRLGRGTAGVLVAQLTAVTAVATAATLALRHLTHAVRQERHLTGESDRLRHLALLLGGVAGDATRPDLRPLRHEAPEQVDVLVVDPLDLFGVEDRDLLLLRAAPVGGRALGVPSIACHLEGLLAVVRVVVLGGLGRGSCAATPATPAGAAGAAATTEVAASAALVAGDLGSGPAQARTDLVGHDLHHAALLAVLGLPAALLEAAGDDHARALAQRLRDVLGHLAPAHDVEEAGLLLPLLRLAVLPPPAHGHAERRLGGATGGVADLGVAGQVPDDGHGAVRHWGSSLMRPTTRTRPDSRRRARGSAGPCAGGLRQQGRGSGAALPSPRARTSPGRPRSSPPSGA